MGLILQGLFGAAVTICFALVNPHLDLYILTPLTLKSRLNLN